MLVRDVRQVLCPLVTTVSDLLGDGDRFNCVLSRCVLGS